MFPQLCELYIVFWGFFFISLINPQAAVIIQTLSEIKSKKHVKQMSKTNNKKAVFRWKRKSVALSNRDKYIFFYCFSLLFILDLEWPQRQKRWHCNNNFLYILLHIMIHLTAVGNRVINWVVILENEKLKGQSAQILWTVDSSLWTHFSVSCSLNFSTNSSSGWREYNSVRCFGGNECKTKLFRSGSQRYLYHELNASSSFTFS